MAQKNQHPPAGVVVVPDDIADAWEDAKALHAEAVKAIRRAEPRLRAYLGNAEMGVRENGRVICRRERGWIGVKEIPGHMRDDLRMVREGGSNGNGK
jgi:hypothetical protein